MKRAHALLAVFLAAVVLVLPGPLTSADVCVELPPLKPVHRICGVVIDTSDYRVANAKVSVIKDVKEVVTGEDGKFSFPQLKPGKYVLHVDAEGFHLIGTEIVLSHPSANPRQEIAAMLSWEGRCTPFFLVDAKKFEAKLEPNE